jgi:hypothetical protein
MRAEAGTMRGWIWIAWLVGVGVSGSADAQSATAEGASREDGGVTEAAASDATAADSTEATATQAATEAATEPNDRSGAEASPDGSASSSDDDDHAARRVGGVSVYDDEMAPRFAWDDRNHEFMGVLRIGFGMPYLIAIKYADGPLCEPTSEPDDQTFCARAGEPFLDLEAGFAFTHRLEVVGAVTVSLDEDPIALAKPRAFGIGIRGYTSDEAIVKGFFGARLVLDYTSSDADDWSNLDFGVRGDFGIQVDPIRWLGIFVQGAVGIRLLRGFTFLPEASAGLQIRFP